ncbi:MAG: HAD family hydrolase [Kaiparowitsia implicata GSE-PSE-MK54-09C]|jgi:phosphoglycolate phosphatase-like HAD superfamily hydrolase|nr:HAD family hydrolase [Kaiparowitsia implicata GSE-PSE-MK54-09C]
MDHPTVLALDFDGVVCDGLAEYFQTAWRAYQHLWSALGQSPPAGLEAAFGRLRPVVETGWEMPLVVRSLLLGVSETDLLANWSQMAPALIVQEGLTPNALTAAVDGLRDEWIQQDVERWLGLHRLYPGVGDRLQQWLDSGLPITIISTKEARFIRQILQGQGVAFPGDRIIGKEIQQPKAQTLQQLQHAALSSDSSTSPESLESPEFPEPVIWFVEDRLKTLQNIAQQPDLANVRLFLADWGYNTEGDRHAAQQHPSINLITLPQFAQPFPHWIAAP